MKANAAVSTVWRYSNDESLRRAAALASLASLSWT